VPELPDDSWQPAARGVLDRFEVFLDTITKLEIYRIS
jgi:hypothetical protein